MKQKIDNKDIVLKPDNSPSLIYLGGHNAPHSGHNSNNKSLKTELADTKKINFSNSVDGQERR